MAEDIATVCRREAGAWIIAGIGDGWPLHQAADEIDRLRAERDAWKTAAMGASTQTVRLREQIIEWAKSLNEADVPRTAAEDALLSVAYGDYKEDDRG